MRNIVGSAGHSHRPPLDSGQPTHARWTKFYTHIFVFNERLIYWVFGVRDGMFPQWMKTFIKLKLKLKLIILIEFAKLTLFQWSSNMNNYKKRKLGYWSTVQFVKCHWQCMYTSCVKQKFCRSEFQLLNKEIKQRLLQLLFCVRNSVDKCNVLHLTYWKTSSRNSLTPQVTRGTLPPKGVEDRKV